MYSVNCLLPHTGEEVAICCNVAAITVLAAGSCRPANEEKFSEATNRPFAASEVSSLRIFIAQSVAEIGGAKHQVCRCSIYQPAKGTLAF